MNIYDFAIDFEIENREFYEECAANTSHEDLKKVFLELAEEEKKHENIVRQLKENKEVDEVESGILPKAKEAFDKIADNMPTGDDVMPEEQVDVYKKAIDLERKSYEFYTEKAEESDSELVKKTFKRLAEEEKKHEKIMDNITEMVDRPNTWLEDAEWYHLEDY
ncbi:rubrerythrin [Halanaerobium saccharolyticum]|jgi:rubrerythrin|uniref:Rubrerythrin n=1 Tax=Halanaerobium saccharolyticum TaxID=43595 RepID=A0A2T5RKK7_9FIRM|nr:MULTISPECIES: ferritin family protein [Halanaerobium]OEG63611.1 MAG: rubrerythrin [Halanaerobium sp. MDAL1]PTV99555.1 rubrerythrin [Halanaerobium saccharolyticum]PUU94912.1 MAG: rubrerythrin [Halanaerobium sp.]PUU95761.1 MAG: rubrerythrin [Halanaerobium sp.]TDP98284.1 rubrerythrin [Halanaerobium saccharolyticum]